MGARDEVAAAAKEDERLRERAWEKRWLCKPWRWKDYKRHSFRLDDVVIAIFGVRWRVITWDGEWATPEGFLSRADARGWADANIRQGSSLRCLEGPTAASRWQSTRARLEASQPPSGAKERHREDQQRLTPLELELIEILREVEWGRSSSPLRTRPLRKGDYSCPYCGRERVPKLGAWNSHDPGCRLAKALGSATSTKVKPKAPPKQPEQIALFGSTDVAATDGE